MKFVNRKSELKHLEQEYIQPGPKFIVIYGRRRVGKTRLIEEFTRTKEDVAYYLAAQESDNQQISEFKEVLSPLLQDDFLRTTKFESWKHLFSYLGKVWPRDRRFIVAIDEVTFIIKSNPSFTSYLQNFWDNTLSKSQTILLLSGSLVGLMLNEVLSQDSPLHGRRTSQIKVEPLTLQDARGFMPNQPLEVQVSMYALTGGVPKYLQFIQPKDGFKEFVIKNFFSREGFFYQEGLFLLSQEFKDPSTYLNILKAISFGNSRLQEISNFTGIDSRKISGYLDILSNLGFTISIIPVTEEKKAFRGALYALSDNFLSFWHRFIFNGRSSIEFGEGKELYVQKKDEITSFIGRKFEGICREICRERFKLDSAGTWWGHERDEKGIRKEIEIDICGLKKDSKEIFLGECKWQEKVNAKQLLAKLKEKAKYIGWNKEQRKEHYVLFAKSFKNKIAGICFDLGDIEKML